MLHLNFESLVDTMSVQEKQVVDFLLANPYPTDDQLHSWCEDNGLDVHEVEKMMYAFATAMAKFLTSGRSVDKDLDPATVTPEVLAAGITVEYEHIVNDGDEWSKRIAEKIALDHIAESEKYYEELAKMEENLKGEEEEEEGGESKGEDEGESSSEGEPEEEEGEESDKKSEVKPPEGEDTTTAEKTEIPPKSDDNTNGEDEQEDDKKSDEPDAKKKGKKDDDDESDKCDPKKKDKKAAKESLEQIQAIIEKHGMTPGLEELLRQDPVLATLENMETGIGELMAKVSEDLKEEEEPKDTEDK